MYINKTTKEERQIIQENTYHLFDKLQSARRLLNSSCETMRSCMGNAEPQVTVESRLDEFLDTIEIVDDLIFNICVEYGLMVGDDGYDGVPACKESMKRILLMELAET